MLSWKDIFSKGILTVLQKYVSNVDTNKIKVSLFRGDMILSNLEIKSLAFDELLPNVPFYVRRGVVGKLKISLPKLINFGKSPIIVEISDFFLLVNPKVDKVYDQKEDERRQLRIKQSKILRYEKEKKKDKQLKISSVKKKKKKNSKFYNKIIETILNNVHVAINDIHVRYEDMSKTFSQFGFNLESLQIVSTDENWRQTFIKEFVELSYKLITINNCSMYLNHQKGKDGFLSSQTFASIDVFKRKMKDIVFNSKSNDHLLAPITAKLKLKMRKLTTKMDFSSPQFEVDFEFPRFFFDISDKQYRSIVRTCAYLVNFEKMVDNLKYRPTVSVKESPKDWWQYAFKSVRQKKRRKRVSWKQMKQWKIDKMRYIFLYKKAFKKVLFKKKTLTKEEESELFGIERKYPVPNILLFRRLADAELELEGLWKKKKKKTLNDLFKKRKTPQVIISEQQKMEIMKSVENQKIDLPKNFATIYFHANFQYGHVNIFDYISMKKISQVYFKDLEVGFVMKEEEFDLKLTMDDFGMSDFTNKHFEKVISRPMMIENHTKEEKTIHEKNEVGREKKVLEKLSNLGITEPPQNEEKEIKIKEIPEEVENKETIKNVEERETPKLKEEPKKLPPPPKIVKKKKKKLFSIGIEQKVIDDQKKKYFVSISFDRINFLANFNLFQRLYSFFNLEDQINIQEFTQKTSKQIKKITTVAKHEFSSGFQTTTIDLKVNIKAPNIFIPLDTFDENTRFLYLQLGNLEFVTLKDNEFNLKMSEIQVSCPREITINELLENKKDIEVVEEISSKVVEKVNFIVSIKRNPEKFPKFVCKTKVDSMNLNLSPKNLRVLFLVLNIVGGLFSNPSGIYSKDDLLIDGNLNVRGPFTSEKWIKTYIQSKVGGCVYFYDESLKRLACLELNDKCSVMKSDKTVFKINLYQEEGKYTHFYFQVRDETEVSKWIGIMKEQIVAKKSSNLLKKLMMNLKEDELVETVSSAQVFMDLESMNLKFWLNMEALGTIQFRKCNVIVDNKKSMNRISMKAMDLLVVNSNGENFVVTKQNTNDMIEVYITLVSDKKSKVFKEEKCYVIFDFILKRETELSVEPLLLLKILQFSYDVRFLVIELLRGKRVYSKINSNEISPYIVKFKFDVEKMLFNGYDVDRNTIFYGGKLNDLDFSIQLNLDSMLAEGKLDNLIALDKSTKVSVYPHILDTVDTNSCISFSYLHKFSNITSDMKFSQFLVLKMNKIRYYFVLKILGNLNNNLKGILKKIVKEEKKINHSLSVDVEITEPAIVFPQSHDHEDNFVLQCSKISIKNDVIDNEQEFMINFENINLLSNIENERKEIINKLDMGFVISNEKVVVNFSNAVVRFSQKQFQFVFKIINHNIIANIPKGKKVEVEEKNKEKEVFDNEPVKASIVVSLNIPKVKVIVLNKFREHFLIFSLKKMFIGFQSNVNEFEISLLLNSIELVDVLNESTNSFKKIMYSKRERDEEIPCLDFRVKRVEEDQLIDMKVSSMEIFFIPVIFKDMWNFFVVETKYILVDVAEKENAMVNTPVENIMKYSFDLTDKDGKEGETSTVEVEPVKKIQSRFIFTFGKCALIFPEDESVRETRLLFFEISEFNFYTLLVETGCFSIGLKTYIQHKKKKITIIDLFRISSKMERDNEVFSFNVDVKNTVQSRLSYNDIKTIIVILKKIKKTSEGSKIPSRNVFKSNEANLLKKNIRSLKNTFKLRTKLPISLFIVDDIKGYDIPLMIVHLKGFSSKSKMRFSTNELVSKLYFFLSVNYFNFRNSEWEPILEKTRDPIAIKFEGDFNEAPEPFKVHFVSRDVINFNITREMIMTLSKTLKLWIKGFSTVDEEAKFKRISEQFKPYAVVNKTGIPISFQYRENKYKLSGKSTEEDVRFGIHFPFKTTTDLIKLNEYLHNISIGSKKVKRRILISKEQTVRLRKEKEPSNKLIVNIKQTDEGTKVIVFHSALKIVNRTNRAWKIGCWLKSENNVDKKLVVLKNILELNEEVFIPIKYMADGILTAQPKTNRDKYKWIECHEKLFNFKTLSKTKKPMLVYSKSEEGKKFFCVFDFEQQESCMIVNFFPPLIIENFLCYDLEFSLYSLFEVANVDKTNKVKKLQELRKLCTIRLPKKENVHIHRINLKKNIWMKCKLLQSKMKWSNRKKDYVLVYSFDRNVKLDNMFLNYDVYNQAVKILFDYDENMTNSFHRISLYSNYLIINKTGLKLLIKANKEFIAGQNRNEVDEKGIYVFDYVKSKFFGGNTISLSFPMSEYVSKGPFSIDKLDSSQRIEMIGVDRHFSLSVYSELMSDNMKTKVVSITPSFFILNKTDGVIFYRQNRVKSMKVPVQKNERNPLYWQNKVQIPKICIKTEGFNWSSPFYIQYVREIPLIIESDEVKGKKQLFRIQISENKHGVIFIIVENTEKPPYYIWNKSQSVLKFCQFGCKKWTFIKPNERIPYSWEKISGKHSLILKKNEEDFALANIDIVSFKTKFKKSGITVRIDVEDITRVVVIEERNKRRRKIDLTKMVKRRSKSFAQKLHFKKSIPPSSFTKKDGDLEDTIREIIKASCHVRGIGFSFIDSEAPKEVFYIFFDDIKFKFVMTSSTQYYDVKLRRCKINNQLSNTLLPITFINSDKIDGNHGRSHFRESHFFCFTMVRNYKEKSFNFIPYLSFKMKEADLCFDRDYVNQITKIVMQLSVKSDEGEKKEKKAKIEEEDDEEEEEGEKEDEMVEVVLEKDKEFEIESPQIAISKKKKTYIRVLQIHPIKFNLSYYFNEIVGKVYQSDSKQKSFNIFEKLGVQFRSNIEDVPITLPSFVLQHPYMTSNDILKSVTTYYSRYLSNEMYKLIGSFNFIGNPMGLAQDIDKGVQDLCYEPLYSGGNAPTTLNTTKSIAKGTLSFMKHSIHGTFGSFSKISETLGNGISYLFLDTDFVEKRTKRTFKKTKHVGEGLVHGVKDLSLGLYEGATGVFTQPIKGAKRSGISGFFIGLGKGVIGLPLKPITGVLDFTSKTTKGIKNTTKYFEKEKYERTRKPRVFSYHGSVIPFDEVAAYGQGILFHIEQNKYKSEKYIHHIELDFAKKLKNLGTIGVSERKEKVSVSKKRMKILMLSHNNLFLLTKSSLYVEWVVKITDISKIVWMGNVLSIKVERKYSEGGDVDYNKWSIMNFLFSSKFLEKRIMVTNEDDKKKLKRLVKEISNLKENE